MQFSIITPSYQSGDWLPLCVRSVADQDGVELEHIVQDAGSTDGTLAFLSQEPSVRTFVEKDSGMYDAINRGIRRSSGEIVAYLNADEQYLPGALAAVQRHFASHPETDILVSDYLVTDATGQFICRRLAHRPYWAQLWYRFGFSTAGLFIRRRVFFERDLWFRPDFRVISDVLWYLAACQAKCRWDVLRFNTSIFTETGTNLALRPESLREAAQKKQMIPIWVRLLAPFLIAHYRFTLLRAGFFKAEPLTYHLYTSDSPQARKAFHVQHATCRWPKRV